MRRQADGEGARWGLVVVVPPSIRGSARQSAATSWKAKQITEILTPPTINIDPAHLQVLQGRFHGGGGWEVEGQKSSSTVDGAQRCLAAEQLPGRKEETSFASQCTVTVSRQEITLHLQYYSVLYTTVYSTLQCTLHYSVLYIYSVLYTTVYCTL